VNEVNYSSPSLTVHFWSAGKQRDLLDKVIMTYKGNANLCPGEFRGFTAGNHRHLANNKLCNIDPLPLIIL